MSNSYPTNEVLPLSRAARALAVPAGWLRGEVEAGRLPGVIAGKAILIHLPTVEKLLAERAKRVAEGGGDHE